MVLTPQVTSITTTHRVTQAVMGGLRPSFPLSFTLPLISRDYPYGMPTMMMKRIKSSGSTYEDNSMAIASPINPYLESGSPISNSGRMAQPQGGLQSAPRVMPFLTTISLQSTREQIDESNDKIVNMLTHQIGIVFNPLIPNTNHSY